MGDRVKKATEHIAYIDIGGIFKYKLVTKSVLNINQLKIMDIYEMDSHALGLK